MFLIILLVILVIFAIIAFIPLKCNAECYINKSDGYPEGRSINPPNYHIGVYKNHSIS